MVTYFPPYALQPSKVIPSEFVLKGFSATGSGTSFSQDPTTGFIQLGCGWWGDPTGATNTSSALLTDGYALGDPGEPGPFFNFAASGASAVMRFSETMANQGERFWIDLYEDPYNTGAPTNNEVRFTYNPLDKVVWLNWSLYDADYQYVADGSVGPVSFDRAGGDAWFKIRFDGSLIAIFETSLDGTTWTEQGRSDIAVPITYGIIQIESEQLSAFGTNFNVVHYGIVKDLIVNAADAPPTSTANTAVLTAAGWSYSAHALAQSSAFQDTPDEIGL